MNSKLHLYAVLLVICSLIPIGTGAYVTSQATGRQPVSRGILDAVVHKDLAVAVGVVALGLAVWRRRDPRGSFLLGTAAAFFALEGWVELLGLPLLHASIAPLVFATFVVIAEVTSSSWSETPKPVEDRAAPALRFFAIASPPLILLQITLGAAYRHKLIGLLPHITGAMAVALPILALTMLILQRHPEDRRLCAAATWLTSIFLTQVVLGVTSFMLPLLKASPIVVIAVTASHVVAGSLTLAANVVLSMRVQRSVYPAPGSTNTK